MSRCRVRADRGSPAAVWGTGVAIVCGCGALAARPPASLAALAATVAVGVIGAVAPVPAADARCGAARWLGSVSLGIAAFVLGRWLRSPVMADPVTAAAVVGTALAAVAEELFFRRLAFGWLERWGTGWAILGAAILFAVVHVPAYGMQALPIDIAAGLVFGWQRWATGGWVAPAVTHVAANLLQMR